MTRGQCFVQCAQCFVLSGLTADINNSLFKRKAGKKNAIVKV